MQGVGRQDLHVPAQPFEKNQPYTDSETRREQVVGRDDGQLTSLVDRWKLSEVGDWRRRVELWSSLDGYFLNLIVSHDAFVLAFLISFSEVQSNALSDRRSCSAAGPE